MIQSNPSDFQVDLSNCDREPIHIPGSIQPHGCILVYSTKDFRLTGYSHNVEEWLGRIPKFGETPSDTFSNEFQENLCGVLSGAGGIIHHIPYKVSRPNVATRSMATAASHHHDGQMIVELQKPETEPANPELLLSLPLRLNLVNQRLQACGTLDELYSSIAQEVRDVSGYDRVMVYRFLEDGHGAVVGESVDNRFGSFLGLHYPATDIPQPARRLYLLNTVRSIADIEAASVGIARDSRIPQAPLDLSYSCFRSVSSIHIEYLRNMGVRASMSISIIDHGRLWGLIACHHYQARYMSFEDRSACEMLGIVAGTYLTARDREQHDKALSIRRSKHVKTVRDIAASEHFSRSLIDSSESLCNLVEADGVAICWNGGPTSWGDVPDLETISQVASSAVASGNRVWSCDSLVSEFGLDPLRMGSSRGLLVVPLAASDLKGLLFFRNEYIHEVHWGGNPNKPIEVQGDNIRLSPRLSFEKWSETVKDRARAWSSVDLEMADDIRGGMIELLSRRAANLAIVNAELRRLNDDLDSFAFAASHDLREPLRGLNHNIYILVDELQAVTENPSITKRCNAIRQLGSRMDDLVQGLLRLSRVGRGDLELEDLDLSSIVSDATVMIWASGKPADVQLLVEDNAGPVKADYACLRELLVNLIGNGVKYNKNSPKSIVVRSHKNSDRRTIEGNLPVVIEVEDNGIGIPSDQIERAFEIFRRLPNSESFGAGTGAGLAIVKKIIHRHGGDIWVNSTPGAGSTFCFTLEASH